MPPLVPFCAECGKEFRCVINGVRVSFDHPKDDWIGYVSADLFECRICSNQIITGWGDGWRNTIPNEEFFQIAEKHKIPIWFVKTGGKLNWRYLEDV